MLTVTSNERDAMVASAEKILMDKSWSSFVFLERGGEVKSVNLDLSIAYCNLIAMENYKTGRFDPAEYFNVVDSDGFSGMYSEVNTLKVIRT